MINEHGAVAERTTRKKNIAQCPFLNRESHMTWLAVEPGQQQGKPATDRLIYGTALSNLPLRHNQNKNSQRHKNHND
jgi:hypothetical protein